MPTSNDTTQNGTANWHEINPDSKTTKNLDNSVVAKNVPKHSYETYAFALCYAFIKCGEVWPVPA